MKKALYLLFVFISLSNLYSQEFKKQLSIDVCECFNGFEDLEMKPFMTCMNANMLNYEDEIQKLIVKDSVLSEYEQGVKLGKKLMFEMQQYLIQDCDKYYYFFDNLREESFIKMKNSFNEKKLDSINQLILLKKSPNLLWQRGNYYFSNNSFNEAERDYLECLEMEPKYVQATLFLGWLNERKGYYDKAIKFYEVVHDSYHIEEVILFIEIAKRKSKK